MILMYRCKGYCAPIVRCVRVIISGGRPSGYHIRCLQPLWEDGRPSIQVCPDSGEALRLDGTPRLMWENVTASTDTATPGEVQQVVAALHHPVGASLLVWLTEGTAPKTADPEGR